MIKRYGTILALGAVCAAANANNLLVNGSFETGDFTGWSTYGNTGFLGVNSNYDGYGPQDGSYFVSFGGVGSDGYMAQTFTDTVGETLYISGWLAGNGTSPSDWGMSFDGVQEVLVNPVPSQGYTQYSFTAIGTGSDKLTVNMRNDPDWDATDNFVVSTTASVPGPAAIAPFALGLIGLIRRRKAS